MFNLQVGQSLISTKHKALMVNVKFVIKRTVQSAPRNSVQIRDYTPFSCGLLHQSQAIYNCNGLIAAIENKSDSLDAIMMILYASLNGTIIVAFPSVKYR